jgi:hypothetical protein
MSNNPRTVFKTQLESLRTATIRNIQVGLPNEINDGLDVYQRLLEELLKSFKDLELVGPRPVFNLSMFGPTSGEELGWLHSDYSDFFRQALRSKDSVVIVSVLEGLMGIVATCTQMGNLPDLDLFLQLMTAIWNDSKRDLDEQNWLSVRRTIVSILTASSRLLMSRRGATSNGDDDSSMRNSTLMASVAKTYGNLMKQSVDTAAMSDFNSLVEAVRETEDYLSRFPRGSAPDLFSKLSIRYLSAAAMGVGGWILFCRSRGALEPEQFSEFWMSFQSAIREPWDTLAIVNSFQWRAFLGWSSWEAFSESPRNGFLISITGYVEDALTIVAANLHESPVDENFIEGDEGPRSVREIQSMASELLSRLDDARESESWIDILAQEHSLEAIRGDLESIRLKYSGQLEDDLIAMDLDSDRVAQFFTAVLEGWEAQQKIMDLLPSAKWQPEPSKEQQLDASLSWRILGPYVTSAKDFFAETHVSADPKMLAFEFVRALAQSEAVLLRTELIARLDGKKTKRADLVATIREEVERQRSGKLEPIVALFGNYRLLHDVRDENSADGVLGVGIAGQIADAKIFWETGSQTEYCIVFDPLRIGRTWWREVDVSDSVNGTVVRDGRRTIEVSTITESIAVELSRQHSPHDEQTETSSELKVRDLLQQVLVRFQEIVAIEIFHDFGIVYEVVDEQQIG